MPYGYGGSRGGFDLFSAGTVAVLAVALGIVGGILLYTLFLNKNNEGKFSGFAGWLYEFLNFKKMLAEMLLKITYLMAACIVTLFSLFVILPSNFLYSIFVLVFGNVILRLGYEFSLVILIICRNTTEINNKTKGDASERIETVTNRVTPVREQRVEGGIWVCSRCAKKNSANDMFCGGCGNHK
ncbi:MAG: hypothetical protein FWH05_01835 [Oscillospiraceae bacterium]|nr:hypothetical protein [Oscillospiraceae bacterium]